MKKFIFTAFTLFCVSCFSIGVGMIGAKGTGTSVVPTGFVTTWETTGVDETITLPLRSGFSYNMTVDWGDESGLSTVTAYDDVDRIHEYALADTYTVTIKGTCEAWFFANGGDKLKFRSVVYWGDVGFTGTGLHSAFYGCSGVTSFQTTIPNYSVTSLYKTWYGCSSVTSFPDVNNLTSVDTLYETWYGCSSATSFPAVSSLTSVDTLVGTWGGCSSGTSFPAVNSLTNVTLLVQTWSGCSTATFFPAVNSLTSVTSLYQTWRSCTGCTTVPVLPSASTALTSIGDTMKLIGSGMSGVVSDLWNAGDFPNISSFTDAFTGATGLDNYGDIPDAWKGL